MSDISQPDYLEEVDLQFALEELREQRDELLAALKYMLDGPDDAAEIERAHRLARAAVARAEGRHGG